MLIQGKLLSYGDDLSEVYMIRRKVFIDELKIPEEVEFDGRDDMAIHAIVYEEAGSRKAIATGRIYFDGVNCEIGHIAVLEGYRYKKYGDFTVRLLLNKAFTADIKDISIVASSDTVAFFEKIGFHITSELDLKHKCYKMMINKKSIITECHKMT